MNLAVTVSIYAGGPGSGCTGSNCGRKVTLYHGTSVENARSILQYGFDPKRNLTKDEAEDPKTTSFSKYRETAENYSGGGHGVHLLKRDSLGKTRLVEYGGTGAVVVVKVPENVLSKMYSHDKEGADPMGESAGEYNVKHGKFPKEYIHHVELYEKGKKTVLRP